MTDLRVHFQDLRYDWERDLDVQWNPEGASVSAPTRDAIEAQPQRQEAWQQQVAVAKTEQSEVGDNEQDEPIKRGPLKPHSRQTLRDNSERVTESHPGLKSVPRPMELWLVELFEQARLTKKFRGRFDLIDGPGSTTYEEPVEEEGEAEEERSTTERRRRKKRGSPGLGGAFLAVYSRAARNPA